MHDGALRLERYGLGFDAGGRWTTFSVAKSITSTLVGAAIRDGHIRSMDDKVSDYIADMKGSAYDEVSIRQLLTMTSGVRWNEDYADPGSDVARFNNHQPEPGVDSLVSYMRRLPREAPAGTRWHYSTGETNLVGVLLSAATKKPLASYLSEKIWVPAGMEQQATWILSKSGKEISGCCIQAATRDFARFGLFVLNGARVGGQSIVPEGWLAEATTERTGIGVPGRGYGYQWWTYSDGTFAARGIFGQGIFIDPKRKLVIASNANWAGGASDRVASDAREAFYRAVQKAVDDEAAGASSSGVGTLTSAVRSKAPPSRTGLRNVRRLFGIADAGRPLPGRDNVTGLGLPARRSCPSSATGDEAQPLRLAAPGQRGHHPPVQPGGTAWTSLQLAATSTVAASCPAQAPPA